MRDLVTRELFVRAIGICTAAVGLTACSLTPRDGPDDKVIEYSASATLLETEGSSRTSYALIDITPDVLSYVPKIGSSSSGTFTVASQEVPVLPLGVGDVIQVTVFESQAGGLFIPAEAGVRDGNFVQFPEQTIDRSGFITVPYAGSVRALGRTTAEVEAEIVSRLIDTAIEPQATIAIVERNSADVSVIGDVADPGQFELRDAGDRVLDLIARAGGLEDTDTTTTVSLTRGSGTISVLYSSLTGSPAENIFVRPGDTINVSSEADSFYAFGATGNVGEFDFDEADINLNDAMALAGGLLDDRSDPGQVLIFRSETRHTLGHMGIDLSGIPHDKMSVPTVYRVNFRRPDAFFLAAKFPMRDLDVMYVSNSDYNEMVKILDLYFLATDAISNTNTAVSVFD